jgi:hypothetical protein
MGVFARTAAVACAVFCASWAGAATSEYPNGARGDDGNLDNNGGFYSVDRQLDFDLLTSVFEDFILDLVPGWNAETNPVWDLVEHQTGPSFYGADNNNNGIIDTDHLDALAAIVDGGAAAAPGLSSETILGIQNRFNFNRDKVQDLELSIPGVQATFFLTVTVTVTTGTQLNVLSGAIKENIPSLWTINEPKDDNGNLIGNGANGETGLLAEAGEMFEVSLRDLLAAEMTLAPGDGSPEVAHVQSLVDVFVRKFISSVLPGLLADLGEVTENPANNWNASPAANVDLNVAVPDLGSVRVRISSANLDTAINNFKNSFNCTNFQCLGGDASLAATGNLDGAGGTNVASFTAANGNRQAFMAAEGITNPPLQFIPIPLSTAGILDGLSVLGDDEWTIAGGDGSELAFDWETIDQLEYTFTDPPLGGDTAQSTYVMDPTPLAQGGLYYSVQAADDTWTRTVPAFLLNLVEPEGEGVFEGEGVVEGVVEGALEGEGSIEGVIEGEGVVEGVVEGVIEGVLEGALEGEGAVEGVIEGVLEGEGAIEGVFEGVVEGALEGEGAIEGLIEGEGTVEGVVEGGLEGEGSSEGEGSIEGVLEGEGEVDPDCPGNLLRDGGLEAGDLALRWGEDLMGDPSVLLYEDGEAEVPVYSGSFALLFFPRLTEDVIGVGQTVNLEAGRPARLTFQMMITSPDVSGDVNISLGGEPVASIAASSLSTPGVYELIDIAIPAQDLAGSALLSINNASLSGGGVVLMDAFCLTYADEQEGAVEGVLEGEGTSEGALEGTLEGEGSVEGNAEGTVEGTIEGALEGISEGIAEGEGAAEGVIEGAIEGSIEGGVEGQLEGQPEGVEEGAAEGEGAIEEGEDENLINIANALLQGFAFIDANDDGYLSVAELTSFLGTPPTVEELEAFDANGDERLQVSELLAITGPSWVHSADTKGDGVVSLSNLLRCVQIFNQGGYSCAANAGATEDGFLATPGGGSCKRHALDYFGGEDGRFDLQELLRLIQIFNAGGYAYCPEETGSEDGYCILLP